MPFSQHKVTRNQCYLKIHNHLTRGWHSQNMQSTTCRAVINQPFFNGALTRYVKLRVAHAPGMPGTFSPPLTSKGTASDPGMHHGTCVVHVPWCMSGSISRGDEENVPCIPGASATRNFTYLARGPLSVAHIAGNWKCSSLYLLMACWHIEVRGFCLPNN